jgi:hypothetical protein
MEAASPAYGEVAPRTRIATTASPRLQILQYRIPAVTLRIPLAPITGRSNKPPVAGENQKQEVAPPARNAGATAKRRG